MAASTRRSRYFDHNATTPPSEEVIQAMSAAAREGFANPSSPHHAGAAARYLVEKSRRTISRVLNCGDRRIVYTSGGSESINLALRGGAFAATRRQKGRHIVASAVEHRAVLDTVEDLRDNHGFSLSIMPVDGMARLDITALSNALRPDTTLVTLILANNETGTLLPVEEAMAVIRARAPGAIVHLDAVQAPGRIPLDIQALGADLVSLSAHKFHGPKGIGLLICNPDLELLPLITGGPQEEGLRAGTENVAGIVGCAKAVEDIPRLLEDEVPAIEDLRDYLSAMLESRYHAQVFTPVEEALPNTLLVAFPRHSARRIIAKLDEEMFSVSSGSACSSSNLGPSHVVKAMGVPEELHDNIIRFSLGVDNRLEDVDDLIGAIGRV